LEQHAAIIPKADGWRQPENREAKRRPPWLALKNLVFRLTSDEIAVGELWVPEI